MSAQWILTTPRLMLTKPLQSDAADILATYAGDPEVTRYMAWPTHKTLADTQVFLDFSKREWQRALAGPYLIRSRDDGRLLGSTGLAFEPGHQVMTGYVLAQAAWGKGYATEALRAMVALARDLGVKELCALCHPEHTKSQRVLQKGGFLRDEAAAPRLPFPNLGTGGALPVHRYVQTL